MQFNRKLVTGLVAAAIVSLAAPQAMAFSWDGWHVGLDAGYGSGKLTPKGMDDISSSLYDVSHDDKFVSLDGVDGPFLGKNYFKPGKASFGIRGGYFHELENSPVVLGVDFGMRYAGKGKRHDGYNFAEPLEGDLVEPRNEDIRVKNGRAQVQWEGKVNGLVGWKVKDRWLPYATAGLTLDRIRLHIAGSNEGDCTHCTMGREEVVWNCVDLADFAWARDQLIATKTYWSWGLNYGLGVYYALTDNWLVNAEVNRTEMWGLKGHWGTKIKGHQNTFKLGVSYKF